MASHVHDRWSRCGGVFFVFFPHHRQSLTLPIFKRLSQSQAFALMVMLQGLAFASLVAGLIVYLLSRRSAVASRASPQNQTVSAPTMRV
jgi:hypothetical protein